MGWKGCVFWMGAALVTAGACGQEDLYINAGDDDSTDGTMFDASHERCTTFPCTCVSEWPYPPPAPPCAVGTRPYKVDGVIYCCGPDSGAPSDDAPDEASTDDSRNWDAIGDQTVPVDASVPDAEQPQD